MSRKRTAGRRLLAGSLAALTMILGTAAAVNAEGTAEEREAEPAEEREPETVGEGDSGPAEEREPETAEDNMGQSMEGQAGEQNGIDARIGEILSGMTLEQKILQLFIISPEALTGVGQVTAAGEATEAAVREYPVGGLIYMEYNLQSEEQIRDMLTNTQRWSLACSGLPMFLCVDEEGGTVARISGRGIMDVPYIGDMCDIGAAGDVSAASEAGRQMGGYLSSLGFNVDFAPVADVLSNPDNYVVRRRSFGSDPVRVSLMAAEVMKELHKQGVLATYKHFPGHGSTAGDSHLGYAYTSKTMEELTDCDLMPFEYGIRQGVRLIMAGHISTPNAVTEDLPATLSHEMITGVLREKMGYDGIVVTDAMNMGAVTQNYSSADAAVKALQAGCDMILMPVDFHAARQGVLEAVQEGTLTEERIDESLRRILRVKIELQQGRL